MQSHKKEIMRGRLPRLEESSYRGLTAVHWSCTIRGREQGWRTSLFHAHFREILVHAALRYHFVIPLYCLMPDHYHVLFLATRNDADLYLGMRFLRKHTSEALRPARYQEQAYDHALTERELERGVFETTCWYILQNPVRAKLCAESKSYEFAGCVVPGYPDLDIHGASYWDLFWRIHERVSES